ncbi:hypothetical protein B0H14DRAFT_3679709 [Mycena olivaceomarginata]|nr:hypothetical protein B0H14DRAFT_3679709 [Mycena olivaceomarginata]
MFRPRSMPPLHRAPDSKSEGGARPRVSVSLKEVPSNTEPESHTESFCSSRQRWLRHTIRSEIGSHAWEFKDVTRISRMLSPKTPKQGGNRDLLMDYECEVDNSWFEDALKIATTELESSLASDITSSPWPNFSMPASSMVARHSEVGEAVGTPIYTSWYATRRWETEMVANTKLNRTSGRVLHPDSRSETNVLYWNFSEERNRMQLPVAVNKDWVHMLSQANNYARCLFDANPSRAFALVLAYNHRTYELRFLIFHRGGLTSHAPLNSATFWAVPKPCASSCPSFCGLSLVTPALYQHQTISNIDTTIFSEWGETHPCDAADAVPDVQPVRNHPYLYPRARTTNWNGPAQRNSPLGKAHLTSATRLFSKVRGKANDRKNIERDFYRAAKGSFGTPGVLCSYEGVHATGEPISNALFLPAPGEIPDVHWNISNGKAPESAEARTLLLYHFYDDRPLACARREFLPTVYGARRRYLGQLNGPLGWLSVYKAGYMHRDIGIGNVLLAERKWFPATVCPRVFKQDFDRNSAARRIHGPCSSSNPESNAITFAKDIQAVGRNTPGRDGMYGVHHGWRHGSKLGDILRRLPRPRNRSGTPEFMSLGLHDAMVEDTEYLQSPLDDLESFFWLACWAVLFNDCKTNEKRSKVETKWQQSLRNADSKAVESGN